MLLVTQHQFFSNSWVWLRLNVEEWVKFHIHKLLTCHIYLNHDSYCDRFACQFLILSFSGGSIVSICISHWGELDCIVLRVVQNTIFALHNMWMFPMCAGRAFQLHSSVLRYCCLGVSWPEKFLAAVFTSPNCYTWRMVILPYFFRIYCFVKWGS